MELWSADCDGSPPRVSPIIRSEDSDTRRRRVNPGEVEVKVTLPRSKQGRALILYLLATAQSPILYEPESGSALPPETTRITATHRAETCRIFTATFPKAFPRTLHPFEMRSKI
ncbi:predicted protein [Histoplasma capsulatum G186AR]|uniref:Uncharacterized protein n=1 Tax=Ajellomyces capsulatus (strain G186AR / H82 / ATCC MYA-2454 / RMSCC 2432) TaxID=447093 RepID=C0NCR9_AJECG|nr:uncharacterized protein HCBG_00915 [Histoplasma capsulatum G186AR]EEH11460.1 predicted protein [Histoplasma capsulatum G186AR]